MRKIWITTIITLTTIIAMAEIRNEYVQQVLKFEGGYVGNIDGMICTNKGVTLATYKAYRKEKGIRNTSCTDLKNITMDEWIDIFKEKYWSRWKCDYIESTAIAELLCDWCWASGVYGIKYPQQVLGVKVDGIVGEKTLAAINNYPDQEELFNKLKDRREQHFRSIVQKNPSKRKFLMGWLRRNNWFRYFE